jgi:hypothetical protein
MDGEYPIEKEVALEDDGALREVLTEAKSS